MYEITIRIFELLIALLVISNIQQCFSNDDFNIQSYPLADEIATDFKEFDASKNNTFENNEEDYVSLGKLLPSLSSDETINNNWRSIETDRVDNKVKVLKMPPNELHSIRNQQKFDEKIFKKTDKKEEEDTQLTTNSRQPSMVVNLDNDDVLAAGKDDYSQGYYLMSSNGSNDQKIGITNQNQLEISAFERHKANRRNNKRYGHRTHKKKYKDYLKYINNDNTNNNENNNKNYIIKETNKPSIIRYPKERFSNYYRGQMNYYGDDNHPYQYDDVDINNNMMKKRLSNSFNYNDKTLSYQERQNQKINSHQKNHHHQISSYQKPQKHHLNNNHYRNHNHHQQQQQQQHHHHHHHHKHQYEQQQNNNHKRRYPTTSQSRHRSDQITKTNDDNYYYNYINEKENLMNTNNNAYTFSNSNGNTYSDNLNNKWPHLSRVHQQLYEEEQTNLSDNDDNNDEDLPPYIKKYNRRNKQLLNLLEGTMPPSTTELTSPSSPTTTIIPLNNASSSSSSTSLMQRLNRQNFRRDRLRDNRRRIDKSNLKHRYHNHKNPKWIVEDLFEEQRANPNNPNRTFADQYFDNTKYVSVSSSNSGSSSSTSSSSSSSQNFVTVSSPEPNEIITNIINGGGSSRNSISSSTQIPSTITSTTVTTPLIKTTTSATTPNSYGNILSRRKEDDLKFLEENEFPGVDISISTDDDGNDNDEVNDSYNWETEMSRFDDWDRKVAGKGKMTLQIEKSSNENNKTYSQSIFSSSMKRPFSNIIRNQSLISNSQSKIGNDHNNNNNRNNTAKQPIANRFIYHRVDVAPRAVGAGDTGRKQRLPFVAITDRRLETSKMLRQQNDFQQNIFPMP